MEKAIETQGNVNRVKYACYASNVTMAVVGNLSPLLFLTFREMYGISFTLLGALVAINFASQLLIDLIFSFFSHKFNIQKTVRLMPILSIVGFVVYALSPFFFEGGAVYIGLLLGTVIFSVSSGLAEVLISPIFAALPSKNPDRDMSKLHAVYAWGAVAVIVLAATFLLFFRASWYLLPIIFLVLPCFAAAMFFSSKIPQLETPKQTSGVLQQLKNKGLWLCVLGIFFGGASECTMAQWASGYLEGALGIEKVWGDIFGVAMFALTLGLGRTLYAKFGKNIRKVLLLCGGAALCCYLTAALVPVPLVGLIACGLTGFCTSMMWPGSLVVASERFPESGVFIYAMMAAGGDLGAALGPQIVGAVADGVSANTSLLSLAESLSLTIEQLGLRAGLLCGAIFPLMAIFIFALHLRLAKKNSVPQLLSSKK